LRQADKPLPRNGWGLVFIVLEIFYTYQHIIVIGMKFEIVSEITAAETIAVGTTIRELSRLNRAYGKGRWRKRKGLALVKLPDGTASQAEIHWYEATGIGKKEFKIKRLID
jgi:hypothetical protein